MLIKVKTFFSDIMKYLKAVRSEVKRVSWPSQVELKAATLVVIATLIIVTGYLWIVDTFLMRIFFQINKI